jgi:mannose-1-phosphate guanylyltransferase
MEHTKKGIMVPLNAKWSDLGTWSALLEHGKNDKHSNFIKGDVILDNVGNSCIHANSRKILAIGVRDHIIVETKDAVLIMHKDYCQNLKNIIKGE